MAEVGGVGAESKVLEVLIGVTEISTKETNNPRYLHPQQEERQGGKRAVDGVVTRHPYLRMDVGKLKTLHSTACQDARYYGAAEIHLRVWHEDVKEDEYCRHQQEGGEVDEKTQQRTKDVGLREVIAGEGSNRYRESRRHHNTYRSQEEHRGVIGYRPVDAAGLVDLPDIVEHLFYVVDKHYYGPQHKQQADA